jgi:general secretion pathway protein A
MKGTLSPETAPAGRSAGSAPDRPAAAGPEPFLNRPSPECFFAAQPHREAWSFLRRGLRAGAPYLLLTGAFGAGKTMLALRLVRAIRARGLGPCVHMSTPAQGAATILRSVAAAAEVPLPDTEAGAAQLAAALRSRLAEAPRAKPVFLVVEDPQDLDPVALEALLSAVPAPAEARAPLSLVLIGHSTLPRLLQRGCFQPYDRRIRRRHHLAPLNAEETRDYIAFRLARAGDGGAMPGALPAFAPAALDRVYELTRGNPREINNHCGIALDQARARGCVHVDRGLVNDSARALGRTLPAGGAAGPVVVRFPAAARPGPPVRGCPDYVRGAPAPQPRQVPAHRPPAAARAAPSAGTPGAPVRAQSSAARRWSGPAMAALLVLLGGAYLAAPHLAPDDGARTAALPAPESGLTRAERQEVEALLSRLDFETGPVDGELDQTTRAAVQAYRRMAGLTPGSAAVGPALLADLRAVAANLDTEAAPPAPGQR